MNTLRIGFLCAAAWTFAAIAGAPAAFAIDGWLDGRTPSFGSGGDDHDRWLGGGRAIRTAYPAFMTGGPQPNITPVAPPIVPLEKSEPAGSVIIDTRGRRLFYVLANNQAYQYPISVGRIGFTWTGTEKISKVADWPTWTPPPEMIARQPWLPRTMTGGVNNPLGAKALYLGNSLYRIHGTNEPKTIGLASSSGCFRMMNHHVIHLSTLAGVGTEVRVVARY